ncbi:uncharacterized protein SCHCODRAFT_02169920 [Schizophyllum commune H4-8]|uniref:uncharacterized protein n=1 Tax=Schizophyllum commune (strain H4-8 / FGSC 9210) TaxID=578458 RepID=UPI00215FBB5B|nr:uncharacterized protein SCHCODRAFT_02169920 [Schizophyllum commune H4-8]KAI5898624.1 hypothetical protein SCHCODRAFT_02169920 [Schizophyllum commune H4-8]
MSHLKRKADGPLLPLRAPKQPRTAFLGYDGANAGPSNLMGVLSKWMASVGEIMESGLNAVRDLSLLPPEESQPVRQANGDARVPQANGHATRPSAPGPSRQAAPTRPVQIPPPPCAPPKSLRPLPASSSQRDAARMPPPPVPNGLRPSTSLPSSSSGSSSTSSSLSSNPAPADVRIAKALEERRRRNELEKQGVARLYEDRPHIYAKQVIVSIPALRPKN